MVWYSVRWTLLAQGNGNREEKELETCQSLESINSFICESQTELAFCHLQPKESQKINAHECTLK